MTRTVSTLTELLVALSIVAAGCSRGPSEETVALP